METADGSGGVARRGLLAAAGAGGLMAAAAAGGSAAKPGGSGGASKVSTPPDAIVETQYGKVRGCVRDGVFVFKGVPYAADTGGAARFLPPQPPKAWTGVRSALAYGPCCPQVVRTGWQSDETAFIYDWDDGFPGEDCLRANVWTPGLAGKARPMMLWIHGGGYEAGSAQELPAYDGERLARRGEVVVVSVNHRLGALGFLDLSAIGGERYALSANAGMLDLVAALQWVKANAAAFGGDPGNVTIFGQSGGAAKVSNLMAMPAAKGLFHKAIVQSGSLLEVGDPARSRQLAAAVIKALGLAPGDVGKLAQVSAVDLVNAGVTAARTMPKGPTDRINLMWQPTRDGTAIPDATWSPGAPAISASVPMIIGSNLNEYAPSLGNASLEEMAEAQAKGMALAISQAPPAAWDELKAAVPGAKPVEWASRLVSMRFRAPAVSQAQRKAAQGGAPAWLYRFDYNSGVLDGRARAFHCAELAYAFDNVDRCLNATTGSPQARALAARMSDAWLAFAHTGDPNHKGLPHWPAVSRSATPNMLFDAACRVVDDPDAAVRAALNA
jgi:para-nitrobenzyl esterase